MIRSLLPLCFLLLISTLSTAQSWQWGKRGGSSASFSMRHESVTEMATDRNGNLYVLSTVITPGLNVDGHTLTTFGFYGHYQTVLSSFSCNGSYRWAKVIGPSGYNCGLATDSLDGVYVAGTVQMNANTNIGTDTSWLNQYKQVYLAKFDTNGNYKWWREPQADTTTLFGPYDTWGISLDVDAGGNLHMLSLLNPGAYVGGAYIVTAKGYHVLRYDRFGNFIGGTPMDIHITGAVPALTCRLNKRTGRYYVTGILAGPPTMHTLRFGTTLIDGLHFVGAFSSSGSLLWCRKGNYAPMSNASFAKPAFDDQQNIYLSGVSNFVGVADSFNGSVFVNSLGPHAMPVAVKLDTNGNTLWAKNANTNASTWSYGIAVAGGEAIITGSYPGKVKWPGFADSINGVPGINYNRFITRFDAVTGAVKGMDTLRSTPSYIEFGPDYSFGSNIVADKRANVYIAGYFEYDLTVGASALVSAGGDDDFFIAKYGRANCNCTMPVANFSSTGTQTVSFTYTGTTGYDSVRWHFGDGGTATGASPAHTYMANGTYTVCATVYNSCGSHVVCKTVTASVGSSVTGTAFQYVAVYPNPATNELSIDNATTGTEVRLYTIQGAEVYNGKLQHNHSTIDVQHLPAGSYLLQLRDAEGNRWSGMVVKE